MLARPVGDVARKLRTDDDRARRSLPVARQFGGEEVYRITPYSPDFERQMKLAEEIMHDARDILRALAK
jgi:hypothetical protein